MTPPSSSPTITRAPDTRGSASKTGCGSSRTWARRTAPIWANARSTTRCLSRSAWRFASGRRCWNCDDADPALRSALGPWAGSRQQRGRGLCRSPVAGHRRRHGRPCRRRGREQAGHRVARSEEHTSELQHPSISYAVFCLKKKKNTLLLIFLVLSIISTYGGIADSYSRAVRNRLVDLALTDRALFAGVDVVVVADTHLHHGH